MADLDIEHSQAKNPAPVDDALPANCVLPLLQALPALGDTTTVILHGGCVFEFKGAFPPGSVAEDFYNLESDGPGLHGHLRLKAMRYVRFQDRAHRGRASFAFVFEDATRHCLFKVFLGRDANGDIVASQRAFFEQLRRERRLPLQQRATLSSGTLPGAAPDAPASTPDATSDNTSAHITETPP